MEVVQKLKRCAKDIQRKFENTVRTEGLEFSCSRTAEEFSQGDYTQWLRELHATYRADLDGKIKVLKELRYTSTNLAKVFSVWEREPHQIQGTTSCF